MSIHIVCQARTIISDIFGLKLKVIDSNQSVLPKVLHVDTKEKEFYLLDNANVVVGPI